MFIFLFHYLNNPLYFTTIKILIGNDTDTPLLKTPYQENHSMVNIMALSD